MSDGWNDSEDVDDEEMDDLFESSDDDISSFSGNTIMTINISGELKELWAVTKAWLKEVFHVEPGLENVFKTPENVEEEMRVRKIRKFNLIEFIASLSGIFILMWGMWWVGIVNGNDNLVQWSFYLIGLIGIWALFISPFVHYKLEKGIVYRKGYLGLDYEQNAWTAFLEERGFGSLKRHWEYNLKDEKMRKIVNMMTLFVLITIIIVLLDDLKNAMNFAESVGIDDPDLQRYAAITALVWAYQILSVILLVYAAYNAGSWQDTGHLDLIKKFLLVLIPAIFAFMGVWLTWGWGLEKLRDGSWQVKDGWEATALMYQTTVSSGKGRLFLFVFFVAVLIFWYLFKYIVLGILIRFDNLKTAMYQFVFVSVIAIIVVFSVWGIMLTPGVNSYIVAHNKSMMSQLPYSQRLWYIFDSTAREDMNRTTAADFFGNWAGYIYWGLVQELLFLGYWCTLLTKALKNKHVIALLSASCFGLIHFPSWPLMVLTMVAGYFWALAWIDGRRYRNLFVMGMIHGFGGTLVARFIPITMSVGPSNMG